MAIFRTIQMSFWTDAKVTDDFTPEDRYFYLYLLTNPHTNLCGCYEITKKQISDEIGYSRDTVEKLIDRMKSIHKVVDYSESAKEILILNWYKFNWTKSTKFRKPLISEIKKVKCAGFRKYLDKLYEVTGSNVNDTVSIRYAYGIDTTVTVAVTDTVPDTDTDADVYYSLDTDRDKDKTVETQFEIFDELIPNYNLSDASIESIREWLRYKSEIKKPYTAKIGLAKLLKRLSEMEKQYGARYVADTIEYSMSQGWQGLFEKNGGKASKADAMNDWLTMQAGGMNGGIVDEPTGSI